MAEHGHEVAVTPDLDPQDTVAVVGVVVGDPFDQPGQGFAVRDSSRVVHAGQPAGMARQSGVVACCSIRS